MNLPPAGSEARGAEARVATAATRAPALFASSAPGERRPRLPESLAALSSVFAGPAGALTAQDARESVIVTAFFDIGRETWLEGATQASRHRRSSDVYFRRFGLLAELPNPMVVFVEPHLAERALAARRAHGLQDRTAVIVVERPFEREPLAGLAREIKARMTPRLRDWVLHPDAPEYREPRYVLVNALKSAFVNAAADLGVIEAAQVAWVDFGYCQDDTPFDRTRPWRFDAGDRINLFHVAALDSQPITRVVRRGDVYFQGCHIVGPTGAWRAFAREIADALEALLACDLIDDDQTMLLMAWRRDPARYRVHGVAPSDWRVLFRRFNVETPLESVAPPPLRNAPAGTPFGEEFKLEMKRWERRVRTWRRALRLK